MRTRSFRNSLEEIAGMCVRFYDNGFGADLPGVFRQHFADQRHAEVVCEGIAEEVFHGHCVNGAHVGDGHGNVGLKKGEVRGKIDFKRWGRRRRCADAIAVPPQAPPILPLRLCGVCEHIRREMLGELDVSRLHVAFRHVERRMNAGKPENIGRAVMREDMGKSQCGPIRSLQEMDLVAYEDGGLHCRFVCRGALTLRWGRTWSIRVGSA